MTLFRPWRRIKKGEEYLIADLTEMQKVVKKYVTFVLSDWT